MVPQGSSTGTPVGVNPFGWRNYQVNGSFGNESAEYLDGQPLNIGYINLPILFPTQDRSYFAFSIRCSALRAPLLASGTVGVAPEGKWNYFRFARDSGRNPPW